MKIIFYLIGLFVIFPIMAYSSDWECIHYAPSVVSYTDPKTGELKTAFPKNAGECESKMNTANVKYLPNDHVRVWVSTKLVHGDKGTAWRNDLYEIDCSNRKWRFLQIGVDAVEGSVPPEGPSSWYWTEPDGLENTISEAVCKH